MSQSDERRHYRYSFKRHIDIDDVQDTLTLAILGAENLHGRSRVRLDGWWQLDRQRRRCTIDAGTEVGRDIAKLFAGYLAQEFGETSFTVRHQRERLNETAEHPRDVISIRGAIS